MRSAERQPYMFANKYDPATKTRTNCVGIKCKKCPTEEWHSAPGPGWGRRIFKNRGWQCGNSAGQHLCPKCAEMKQTRQLRGVPVDPPKVAEVVQLKAPDVRPAPPPATPPAQPGPLAEALAPLKQVIERKELIKKSRGQPTGFASRTSAGAAARAMLNKLGVANPAEAIHYRVVPEQGGTFGYVVIGSPALAAAAAAKTPAVKTAAVKKRHIRPGGRVERAAEIDAFGPFPEDQRGVKVPAAGGHRPPNPPGRTVAQPSIAASSAKVVCNRFGIADPVEGEHFKLHRVGDKYTYSLIEEAVPFRKPPVGKPAPPAAPAPVINPEAWTPPPPPKPATHLVKNGGGFLSRWDARKAALAAIQPDKKTPGAPSEGVDYWISQDAHNYWTWTTKAPSDLPEHQPEPEATEETAVSDGSSQAVKDAMEGTAQRSQPAPVAVTVREWTREERTKVREAVEEHYDERQECWHGDLTDAKVAEMLKVPRVFVSKVREVYGPDRNRAEDLKREAELLVKKQRIDEAVALAERALNLSNIIIETAAKLETAMGEMKAKRQELGL